MFKTLTQSHLYLNQSKPQTNSDSVRYALVSKMETRGGYDIAKTKVSVVVENQGKMGENSSSADVCEA